MSAFDTYAFVKELRSAGLSEEQAEAQSIALSKALEEFQATQMLIFLAARS